MMATLTQTKTVVKVNPDLPSFSTGVRKHVHKHAHCTQPTVLPSHTLCLFVRYAGCGVTG